MYKLNNFSLRSDVKILIQYTKEKSSVHLHPSQFAQNALECPVLDPVLEHFPSWDGAHAPILHPPCNHAYDIIYLRIYLRLCSLQRQLQ